MFIGFRDVLRPPGCFKGAEKFQGWRDVYRVQGCLTEACLYDPGIFTGCKDV